MLSNRINKLLFLLIVVLLVSQAGLLFIVSLSDQVLINPEIVISSIIHPTEEILETHYSYFANKDFYDQAYDEAQGQALTASEKVYGGIIPHHLIVKDKIAAFFLGLKGSDYKTIILIGPNHFNQGTSNIITSKAKWQTPYGDLAPNLKLINKLGLTVEEEPFIIEHSISGLVPFIKKSFPNSNIVPIILKVNTTQDECLNLAQAIYENIDPEKTLVISSVDFSHYQPVVVANFHDQKSISVIQNFDFERIFNLEIDSPASIYTLLKYLELSQSQKSNLLFSTNSGILTNQPDEPTTSHNIFYFTKGNKLENKIINFLFFGDIMLDRNVKEAINKKGFDYFLEKIAGEEKRFFMGMDLIGANLEGAVTNNGNHYYPEAVNDFAFSPQVVNYLTNYNFNFFTISNNHLTDQGSSGVEETRSNLINLGFNYVGCPDGQVADCSTYVLDIASKKIGMAGFSLVYSKFNIDQAKEKISQLKKDSDFVIIDIHWGVEYVHQFNKTQQDIAHQLIDAGADVVIGHHPHVVQGMEIYKDKTIFYSLGNFIFDQYFSADTQEGLSVGLVTNTEDQFEIYLFPFKSRSNQIELLAGSEKAKFLEKFIGWSSLDPKYQEQEMVKNQILLFY